MAHRTILYTTLLLLLLPATLLASEPKSKYFESDQVMSDLGRHPQKTLWVEDGDDKEGSVFDNAQQNLKTFSGHSLYGNFTIGRMKNRRALVGEHCTVNKLVNVVGVGNATTGLGNILDEDLDNSATFVKGVGVGLTVDPIVSVIDMKNYYARGTKAGFCIVASSGNAVLTLDIVKAMSIGFYRDGELLGSKAIEEGQGGEGITLSLIQIPTSDEAVIMLTATSDWVFDEISLDKSGGVQVSVGENLKVKYAFVGEAREYKITNNGIAAFRQTSGNSDVELEEMKGWNPVLLGIPFPLVKNEIKKLTDDNYNNYATLTPLIAIGYQGGAKFMMKHADNTRQEVYPAGTEVGFKYKFGSGLALDAGAWIRLILFDRNGNKVQEETIKAEVLNLSVAKGGDGSSSITSAVPFSGCEIRFHTVLSVNLGAMGIHYATIREAPEIPHHCPINPYAETGVCGDTHSVTLLSNPNVPVTWTCIENPEPEGQESMRMTSGGLVTRLETPGRYTFLATADDGCRDTTVLYYNQFGENAAIQADGSINPDGCGRPLANEMGQGTFAPSSEIFDSSGSLISVSGISGKENIVSKDFNTYAEYTSGLNIASNLSIIGVKKIATAADPNPVIFSSLPGGDTSEKRIGFIVESKVTGLDLSALQFLQIRCYRKGEEVYRHVISENNAVSAGIAGSDQMQKVRYSITLPMLNSQGNHYAVDEFQLWTSGVLNLGGSKLRIYYAFIEEESARCSDPLGCSATVVAHNTTHATLNGNASTMGDAVSVAKTINNISRFLDNDPNTAMTLALPVNAGGITLAVNLGQIADAHHQIGIIVDNKTYLAQVSVGSWMKASLYYQGQATGDEMTDWSVVGADVAGSGDKNFLFITPTQPCDEIRLEIGGVLSALDVQQFYGIFIRRDADGDGLPDCQDIDSCPAVVEGTTACQGQVVELTLHDRKTPDGTSHPFVNQDQGYTLIYSEPGVATKTGVQPDINGYIVDSHTALAVGREHTLAVFDPTTNTKVAEARYSVRPRQTAWRTTAASSNWNNWDNWTDGTPYCCTDVVIPTGARVYPTLTKDVGNTADTYCCDRIFIEPRGVVNNTTVLNYKRAWVETEYEPNGYRLFSPPLKNIYTGDMFIPAGTYGISTADYFQEIGEAQAPQNRFNPSVYQRLYEATAEQGLAYLNPSSTAVEHKDITGTTAQWTHHVNGVTYRYPQWQAVSLWVDNGSMEAAPFRFRFPKAHDNYNYYSDYNPSVVLGSADVNHNFDNTGDANGSVGSHRFIYETSDPAGDDLGTTWDYHYKLPGDAQARTDSRVLYTNHLTWPDVTLTTAGTEPTTTFLFGNPFMGNIRLDKFFQANTNVAAVKFLKSDGNINEQSTILSSGYATADVKVLAPMEGMFVVAKNAVRSLTLTIDTDMMIPDDAVHQQHSPGQGSRAAAYGGRESFPAQTPTYGGLEGASPTLRLTATMPRYRSATLLVSGDDAPTSEALLDSEVPPTLAVYALTSTSTHLTGGVGFQPTPGQPTQPTTRRLKTYALSQWATAPKQADTPASANLSSPLGGTGGASLTRPCDIAPLSAAVTPLCVIVPDTATVSLTVTTTGQLPRDEYYILDRISGTRWRLDDDITLEGCGTTIGRYALVHGDVYAAEPTGIDAAEADDDGVTIAISGPRVMVTSTRRELRHLTLTATDGRALASQPATGHTATISAQQGIVILSVAFADGTHTAYKLRLR